MRQLLTESLILAIAGGAAGIGLAWWALRLLVAAAASSFPRVAETQIDLRVLLFTVLLSLATGVLFGLAPAFVSSAHATHETPKEGARGSSHSSPHLRPTLIVAELALSLALLAGSGLLIRSFLRLQDVDTGFRPDGVLRCGSHCPSKRMPSLSSSVPGESEEIRFRSADRRAFPSEGGEDISVCANRGGLQISRIKRTSGEGRDFSSLIRWTPTAGGCLNGCFRNIGIGCGGLLLEPRARYG
jgi:hypothetical protein